MASLWSVALRAALRAFDTLGIQTVELCRACGIDQALLDDVDARVPVELTGRIWPVGARMWGRAGLGLYAGCGLRFGMLEALDYAFATAPNVRDGLLRIAAYFDVVTNGLTKIRVAEAGGGTELRVEYLPMPLDDLRDYGIASLVQRVRWAGAEPLRVELRGGPVAKPSEYEALLACPVFFERESSALVISATDAARPMPASFPGLRDVIDREMTRLLQRAAAESDPLLDVRREVFATLGGVGPSLQDVARRLAVSERTLQRRLAQQQTTFKDIVDDIRRALALDHLGRDQLSVAEIGFLLGFSEPSAFSRAFHRWTGERPADHRARALASSL